MQPTSIAQEPSFRFDRDAVARAARVAAIGFVNGEHWSKRQLVAWLLGAYRRATTASERPAHGRSEGSSPRVRTSVTAVEVGAIVESARAEVLEALATHASRRAAFMRAVDAGHVVPFDDGSGRAVLMPVDVPGMRLADRVIALFTADFVARPDEYATLFTVCARCKRIHFDVEARARLRCVEGAHGSRADFPRVA